MLAKIVCWNLTVFKAGALFAFFFLIHKESAQKWFALVPVFVTSIAKACNQISPKCVRGVDEQLSKKIVKTLSSTLSFPVRVHLPSCHEYRILYVNLFFVNLWSLSCLSPNKAIHRCRCWNPSKSVAHQNYNTIVHFRINLIASCLLDFLQSAWRFYPT